MKITNILLILALCLFNAKSWSQEVPAGDTTPSAGADTSVSSGNAETTPAVEAPSNLADPEFSPDNGSDDEGSIDEGNADSGNSDEGSIDEGSSQGSSKNPSTGKKPESEKKPEGSISSSREQAEESAAREIGRVIGRKIGQDAVSKMNKVDRKALLERTRTAIRGEILRKYVFSESPFMNSFVGSMMVLREGKDYAGFKCKELEIDLVYKVQRIYAKPILCQEANGEWTEVDARNVTFPRRAEPTPGHSTGSGGWLPPL
jgi:hypothetical protein